MTQTLESTDSHIAPYLREFYREPSDEQVAEHLAATRSQGPMTFSLARASLRKSAAGTAQVNYERGVQSAVAVAGERVNGRDAITYCVPVEGVPGQHPVMKQVADPGRRAALEVIGTLGPEADGLAERHASSQWARPETARAVGWLAGMCLRRWADQTPEGLALVVAVLAGLPPEVRRVLGEILGAAARAHPELSAAPDALRGR